MAKSGIYGSKHVADKAQPGEHRKHTNLKAHQDGLKEGLRLHQGYARTGKAPEENEKPTDSVED